MTSSKYIQITDKILIEYEYFNEVNSSSTDMENFKIDFPDDSLYLYNENGNVYVYNENLIKNDSNCSVENNYLCSYNPDTFVSLNNEDQRYYSAKQWISYDGDEYKPYEFDGEKLNCDKVKVYFTGTYKPENDGEFALIVSTKLENNKNLILGSYLLTSAKDIIPFLIGERLYVKSFEFFVPSTYYNKQKFNLTDSPVIELSLYKISRYGKEETINNIYVKPIYLTEHSKTSISISDVYASIYAKIEEVDDYFKLQGDTLYTAESFSDFINNLPGTYDDYILMHDIVVNELINVGFNEKGEPVYNWTPTTHNVLTQTDDFDEPVLFRPVIKYSNCVACIIDYTLRIYCQSENTQIIKRSTYQDFNYLKYGKKMIKINLGTVPTQINVYNKLDNSKINELNLSNASQSINISQEKIFKTSYITSFRDRINIKASISPVKIQDIVQ